MNDEMNEKVVGIVIRGGKVTSALLAKAMLKVLKAMHQHHKDKKATKPGEISMKKLMAETGGDVQDIEITNENIKSFEKYARKNRVRFSLKKIGDDKHMVIFKARSVSAITASFKQYTRDITRKANRPSVRGELKKLLQQVKNMAQVKTKHKQQEATL